MSIVRGQLSVVSGSEEPRPSGSGFFPAHVESPARAGGRWAPPPAAAPVIILHGLGHQIVILVEHMDSADQPDDPPGDVLRVQIVVRVGAAHEAAEA